MNLRQREPRIKLPKVLEAAKGEQCTVEHPRHCNGNPETTIAAHSDFFNKAKGAKSDDLSIAFACFGCHTWLDQSRDEDRLYYWARGHLRTLRVLYERGVLKV